MWARVDDGWWCHPKVMGLGLAARGLWVSSLSWSCHQRKPVVPWTLLAMLGADETHAAELVDAGLWKPCGDGWEIHAWAEYQDLSTSEKRALAGAKGGKASGAARRSKAKQTDAVTSGNDEASEASAEAGPFPSQPIQKQRTRDPLTRPRLAEFVPPPAEPIAPPPANIRDHLHPAPREASA
jgi:hypothetical protein